MKNKIYLPILLTLWASFAQAAELLSITSEKQYETITLSLKSISPRKIFTLSNPERLVVDVPLLGNNPKADLPASYSGALIKDVRIGKFNPQVSRFVFDLNAPVQVAGVRAQDNQTIEIDIAPLSKTTPREKPLIVIDPGHGGNDPGTIGKGRTQEKRLVLDYAKTLKDKLQKTGRYRVKLTREDDRYILLRKRFDVARKAGASLFISLHADSAPVTMARGLSVYTLSERASDEEAEALAARENKSDILAGINLSTEREDVADILISLAQRETNNHSAMLGDFLVVSLDDHVTMLPNPHRFAGFAVLKAPDIPSVLIEIGFLSNASEEKLLKSKSHRDKVTSGIVTGIDKYFEHRIKTEGE